MKILIDRIFALKIISHRILVLIAASIIFQLLYLKVNLSSIRNFGTVFIIYKTLKSDTVRSWHYSALLSQIKLIIDT